ncbi:hypothetical protein SynPROS91_01454 [Synechococcus sp. PROS-9-1]|nr:hypothetical protein SynPROS91_01454 [Synechococcus sp. PROS-9-1]
MGRPVVRPMSNHKRFTVRYRDASSDHQEECFYAGDAFEARVLAMEEIRYIHDHPHAIDLIRCEDQADALRAA